MQLRVLKAKIHRARVTGADLHYEGSIELDSSLMDTVGILPYEEVQIWSLTNGERWTTYALPAKSGTGIISVNGAAARKTQVGDELIISAFGLVSEKEAIGWKPKVIHVDEENRLRPFARTLKH